VRQRGRRIAWVEVAHTLAASGARLPDRARRAGDARLPEFLDLELLLAEIAPELLSDPGIGPIIAAQWCRRLT